MNRRHQVFLSSTYEDLKDERHAVVLTLLEHHCIPVGMEMFPASDHDPWHVIQRVIDESDYYMVIIGGKYGSCPPGKRKSYTEREYQYAVKQQKVIVAFVRDNLDQLPTAKNETDPTKLKRLAAFRQSAEKKLVRKWTTTGDLMSHVSATINRLRNESPRPGWVPANETDYSESLSERITRLEREVRGRNQPRDLSPRFDNHRAAQPEMRRLIEESVRSNDVTSIRVLSVSLNFSWPFLESFIDKLTIDHKSRVELEIAMVAPEHLDLYDQTQYAEKCRSTLADITKFVENSSAITQSLLHLKVAQYRNLPHWHGMMINDNSLFLGRSNWEFKTLGGQPQLFVGETTYRQFFSDDSLGGADRIALFRNWCKFYYLTSQKLEEYGSRPPD